MITTLQFYVSRELTKTFALAATGLTLVFTLCGGVVNIVQAQGLTTIEMARFLGFVLPISMTFTMPVAALFACAMVYGRIAADREFDACKASGINLYWLLMPAFVLSLFTAGFTFSFSNYVIPSFIARLETMVRADIQKIVGGRLTRFGHIPWGPYVLHAGECHLFEDRDGADILQIKDAAFLQIEKDTLARCGTAREAIIAFTTNPDTQAPVIEAVMYDMRGVDLNRRQVLNEAERPFGSFEIPKKFEEKPKWMNLPQLFAYYKDPAELEDIKQGTMTLRLQIRDSLFYRFAYDRLTGPDKQLFLRGENHRYMLSAEQITLDAKTFAPVLRGVTVIHQWEDNAGEERRRDYQAGSCKLKVDRPYPGAPDLVHLSLRDNVIFIDALDPGQKVARSKIDLDPALVPRLVINKEEEIDTEDLLGLKLIRAGEMNPEVYEAELKPLNLGDRIRGWRVGLIKDMLNARRDIAGILHSRCAFSLSALVTLVLAATLGIIFRGGQVLTAFVISFVPGLLVVVMNIMGRQLTEKPGTYLVGIVIIWASLGLLAIADAIILRLWLRR